MVTVSDHITCPSCGGMALKELSTARLEDSCFCLECGYNSEEIFYVDEELHDFLQENGSKLLSEGKFDVLAHLLHLDEQPGKPREHHLRAILSNKTNLYLYCLARDKNGKYISEHHESGGSGQYYFTDTDTGVSYSEILPEDENEKKQFISSLIQKREANPHLSITIHNMTNDGQLITI